MIISFSIRIYCDSWFNKLFIWWFAIRKISESGSWFFTRCRSRLCKLRWLLEVLWFLQIRVVFDLFLSAQNLDNFIFIFSELIFNFFMLICSLLKNTAESSIFLDKPIFLYVKFLKFLFVSILKGDKLLLKVCNLVVVVILKRKHFSC